MRQTTEIEIEDAGKIVIATTRDGLHGSLVSRRMTMSKYLGGAGTISEVTMDIGPTASQAIIEALAR